MEDDDVTPPQTKRPRLEGPASGRAQYGVTDCVLRRAKELLDFLNVDEVLKAEITPVLTFLTHQETERLQNLQDNREPTQKVISRLLHFVKGREGCARDDACRKLVACIVSTSEVDRGHRDLEKVFHDKLPQHEWVFVKRLVSEVADSPMPSPYRTPQEREAKNTEELASFETPEQPISFIRLQGQLGEGENFAGIEREMWLRFSAGEYTMLKRTVEGVQIDREFAADVDCRVVAKWFNSLIIMHRDGSYQNAIAELLDALVLCQQDECVNRTILEGRIYQRMAQNYLMMDLKPLAMKHFEMAKECLQLVGRGYDKANMFCREAKIMSAVEPHKTEEIEGKYNSALSALQKEDPFFLASFPSVTLSKVAFHLKVSFGSKASREHSLPHMHPADIEKAKQTLDTIDEKEHILLEMRKCEYTFLCAELSRLQGKEGEAREQFKALLSTPGSSKVKNILSLAEQRLHSMEA